VASLARNEELLCNTSPTADTLAAEVYNNQRGELQRTDEGDPNITFTYKGAHYKSLCDVPKKLVRYYIFMITSTVPIKGVDASEIQTSDWIQKMEDKQC
jgi:hypothetical protein